MDEHRADFDQWSAELNGDDKWWQTRAAVPPLSWWVAVSLGCPYVPLYEPPELHEGE
ncbi:hypothetical protein [Actinosynnema sp. ALI-1.44]|uniref:hypothetical protein n=1 Tax=Actinosynnema sp. ALI-1.44 TaxID=1933779 RepID=UPI001EDA8BEE|nr:hypothetical protein [Actinosynnema sp. ALI-1.44]